MVDAQLKPAGVFVEDDNYLVQGVMIASCSPWPHNFIISCDSSGSSFSPLPPSIHIGFLWEHAALSDG